MSERVDLIIDPKRGRRISVELPLEQKVPREEARRRVGVPGFVDLSDPQVGKAVSLLEAIQRERPALPVALFGGTACRLRCPSSNDPASGLRRSLHDIDLAVPFDEMPRLRLFLEGLAAREGSALQFFETPADHVFNSYGEGLRLRYHSLLHVEGNQIELGTLDLIADEFRFCHRIDLRSDLDRAFQSGWTVSPTTLLLTKLQFIQRIPLADSALVPERVLEPIGRSGVAIGPEAKDVQDILALVRDHPLDGSSESIDPDRLVELTGKDWGLWKTASLTLAMTGRSPVLAGMSAEARADCAEKIRKIQEALARHEPPHRRRLFGGPWWTEVDSPQSIDRAGQIS